MHKHKVKETFRCALSTLEMSMKQSKGFAVRLSSLAVSVGKLLTLSEPEDGHLCDDSETISSLQGFLGLTHASFIAGAKC